MIEQSVSRFARRPDPLAEAGTKKGRRHGAVCTKRVDKRFKPFATSRNLTLSGKNRHGPAESPRQPVSTKIDLSGADSVVIDVQVIFEFPAKREPGKNESTARYLEVTLIADRCRYSGVVDPDGVLSLKPRVPNLVLTVDFQLKWRFFGVNRAEHKAPIITNVVSGWSSP